VGIDVGLLLVGLGRFAFGLGHGLTLEQGWANYVAHVLVALVAERLLAASLHAVAKGEHSADCDHSRVRQRSGMTPERA
jgi:hypothetical protein